MNIFVGNLNFRSTEADLRKLFEEYGEVTSVRIITDRETNRSRGFGFVEMSNEEDARAAIDALHGQDMDGRQLNINEARPREPRQPRRPY